MRTMWAVGIVGAGLMWAGCSGAETTDGDSAVTDTTPAPAPSPLTERAGLNPALLEVAKLEDDKALSGGRLAALLASDSDPAVRRAAARALGHIGDPAAAPALIAGYGDADESVAVAAIFATALLQKGTERAPTTALVPLLAHERPAIRAAAVEALGRIGNHETAEAVHALLADTDPAVRGEAGLACWRLIWGAPPLPKLNDESTASDRTAAVEATAIRDRLHAVLLPLARAAATEADATAKWQLVFATAFMRRPVPRRGPAPPPLTDEEMAALRPLIVAWLADADWITRMHAARAAGYILGKEAGAVLAKTLNDPNWNVRVAGLRAVNAAKSEGMLAAVRALAFADPHALVRETAITVLVARKDKGALEGLRKAIAGDEPTTRRAAVGALAALGGPAVLAEIEALYGHADVHTRAAAIAAAAATIPDPPKEGDAAAGEAPPAPAVDREAHAAAVGAKLTVQFEQGGMLERMAVLEAAKKLPAELAVQLAVTALPMDEIEVRGSACDLISTRADDLRTHGETLGKALRNAWDRSQGQWAYEMRQLILKAIADMKLGMAEAMLQQGLEDPHSIVRIEAAKQLTKLTGTEVKPDIRPNPKSPKRPDPVTARKLELPRRFRFTTTQGDIVLELFPDDAPFHVYNLVKLARAGFYDGLIFHRVVPSFVIQGGCPRGSGWGDAGYNLANEFNRRRYLRGTLGMPRSSDPDSGGCQIFINHVPTPHLDAAYTVFGHVVEGLEVVDKIRVGDRIVKARDE